MLTSDHRDLGLALTPTTTAADTARFAAVRQQLERLPYEPRVAFRLRAEEVTLGPIPVSSTFHVPRFDVMQALAMDYAQAPGPLSQRLVLRRYLRLLAAEPGLSWDAFCDEIALLPRGQLWHHNLRGDLPGDPLPLNWTPSPWRNCSRPTAVSGDSASPTTTRGTATTPA